MPNSNFAENLIELRTAANLTQQKLADILGLKDSTIVGYEKGRIKPSLDVIEKLADLFGVSIDFLLGRTQEKENQLDEMQVIMNIYNSLPEEKRKRMLRYMKVILEDMD